MKMDEDDFTTTRWIKEVQLHLDKLLVSQGYKHDIAGMSYYAVLEIMIL